MKIVSLKAHNFCTLTNIDLSLKDKGLVLLLGENRDSLHADSNGAGKSLLLDSICWCLWGKTIRDIKSSDIVNRWEQKNCVVEVELEEHNTVYKIVRTQKNKGSDKPNDLRLYINSEDDTSKSNKATQDRINNVLGLDFTSFRAMMPGAGINLADLTDVGIKEILEQILQIDDLYKARDLAKSLKAEIDKDFLVASRTKNLLEEDIQDLKESLSSLDNKRAGYKQKIDQQKDEAQKTRDSLESKIKEIRKEINELERAREGQKTLFDEKTSYEEEIQVKEKDRDTQIRLVQDKLTDITKSKKYVTRDLNNSLKEIKKIENLEGTCSFCNSIITQEHKEKELELENNKRAVLQKDVKILESEEKEAKDSLRNIDKAFKEETKPLLSKIRDLEAQLKDYNPVRCPKIRDLHIKETKVGIEMDSLDKELSKLSGDENPYEELVNEAKESLKEKQDKLSNLSSKIEKNEQEIEDLEFWIQGFSRSGIRSYVLDKITPYMNERASHYAKLFGNDLAITFHTKKLLSSGKEKEDFNIRVDYKSGGASYKAVSSGEKARADLIISFVLGDLAALRSNKTISFKFLDEPFERIDNTGVQSIMNLLNDQQSRYDTIFVITHKEQFKQLFDKKLTIVKQNKQSYIEGAI